MCAVPLGAYCDTTFKWDQELTHLFQFVSHHPTILTFAPGKAPVWNIIVSNNNIHAVAKVLSFSVQRRERKTELFYVSNASAVLPWKHKVFTLFTMMHIQYMPTRM